jgi:nucleotide-sensitive chloride channel 1A
MLRYLATLVKVVELAEWIEHIFAKGPAHTQFKGGTERMMSLYGMRRFVDYDESGVPVLGDDETLNYRLDDVEVAFSPQEVLGTGTLFITSSRVILLSPDRFSLDIDVSYIVLHAITRSLDSYPKPCLYCQLNQEDAENGPDELFIAPADDLKLREMFDAFSVAAENNPDPPEDGEEEGDDELIYNLDEVTLGAQQAETLAHLESVFVLPSDQFEDADDAEEGDGDGEADEDNDQEMDDGEQETDAAREN